MSFHSLINEYEVNDLNTRFNFQVENTYKTFFASMIYVNGIFNYIATAT